VHELARRHTEDAPEAQPASEPLTPHVLIALQRASGNAAVSRMLQRAPARLHLGSSASHVYTLQTMLNAAGAQPQLKVDGRFGRHTLAALRRFQRQNGLRADGVAGPKTWAVLNRPAAPQPAAQAPATAQPAEPWDLDTVSVDPVEADVWDDEPYLADLEVGQSYTGGEDKSSEWLIKQVFAMVDQKSVEWNEPFERLLKEYHGWSDKEIGKYVGDRHELKPGTDIHVKYLTSERRRARYEVTFGSTLTWGDGSAVDTRDMSTKDQHEGFGIYVMDGGGRLFLGSQRTALFHHSSFLAGGRVAAAGGMKVTSGRVESISNHSGHYTPRVEHLLNVIDALLQGGHRLIADTEVIYQPPRTATALPPKEQFTLEQFLTDHKPEWLGRLPARRRRRQRHRAAA
jgi:hypothetical protein